MTKLRAFGLSKVRPVNTFAVTPAPKVADRFYLSPEWRALIGQIIRERGRRCEDPAHDPSHPRDGGRIYGDHVVELNDGGAPLDKRNVMLRCARCHGAKTAAARAHRHQGEGVSNP